MSLASSPGRRGTASLDPEPSVMAAGEGPCLLPLPAPSSPNAPAAPEAASAAGVQWSALSSRCPTAHGGWQCAPHVNTRRFHGEEACPPSPVPRPEASTGSVIRQRKK